MTGTPASIVELAKILQIASVELMAVTLPDATIIEVTPCLAERWRISRDEIVGHTLAKFGKGRLSARYIADETNDASQNSATRIEVTYSPPVGAPSTLIAGASQDSPQGQSAKKVKSSRLRADSSAPASKSTTTDALQLAWMPGMIHQRMVTWPRDDQVASTPRS